MTLFTTSAGTFIFGVGQNWRALRPLRDPTFAHNVVLYGIIIDNEKLNFSDKTVQHSHCIYHKSYMDCPGMLGDLHGQTPATNHQNYGPVFATSCCGRSATRVMRLCHVCVCMPEEGNLVAYSSACLARMTTSELT